MVNRLEIKRKMLKKNIIDREENNVTAFLKINIIN
jgi:hypothetical protein